MLHIGHLGDQIGDVDQSRIGLAAGDDDMLMARPAGEGFDDIVKYHPTHEGSPVAPKDAIPRMVTAPVADLRAVIEGKRAQAFEPAFDALTKACNDCHAVFRD